MMMLRSLLVVVLLAGTAGAQGQEMSSAESSKWLAFFDRLVETVIKSQAQCDRMAVEVTAVIDANKDAILIARTAKQQGKKLPAAAQQRMVAGVKKMVPGMQKCGQNAKVRAAFAKLDLTRA